MPQFFREDNIFTFLSWISVSLSGVIASASMLVGESIFNENDLNESRSSFQYYGSCNASNAWDKAPLSFGIFLVMTILFVLFTFGIQITLFFKQRQLKKERSSGIMVITYNHDGVTISRRCADQSLGHKLINFDRTVVSPKASFFLFLSNFLRLSLHIILLSIDGPLGPSIISQFAVYLDFCVLFFLFTLVEHYFSPTLFNTIIDYIPWHNREYIVPVNV